MHHILRPPLTTKPEPAVSRDKKAAKSQSRAVPAWLTDLYRERVPIAIACRSRSILGAKVDEAFTIDFPVLIECEGVAIIGNVRHCIKSSAGGYLLGIKINKVMDPCRTGGFRESAAPATSPLPAKMETPLRPKTAKAARLGGGTWRLLLPPVFGLEG